MCKLDFISRRNLTSWYDDLTVYEDFILMYFQDSMHPTYFLIMKSILCQGHDS